jgi:UTP:GlnB (protein PII) uridylyltransferase
MWAREVSVEDAAIATWTDGIAIDVFRVSAPAPADWETVRTEIETCLRKPAPHAERVTIDGEIEIDNVASPWYTIVHVRARDRAGLLYRVASALSGCGISVESATVTTQGGIAVDTFSVVGAHGGKLGAADETRLLQALAGRPGRRRRLRRGQSSRV